MAGSPRLPATTYLESIEIQSVKDNLSSTLASFFVVVVVVIADELEAPSFSDEELPLVGASTVGFCCCSGEVICCSGCCNCCRTCSNGLIAG